MSREQLHLNIEAFIPFSPIGLSPLGAESSAARLVWSDGVHCLDCSLDTWSTFLFSEFHFLSSWVNDIKWFLPVFVTSRLYSYHERYIFSWFYLPSWISFFSILLHVLFFLPFIFHLKPPLFACVSILGGKDPLEKKMQPTQVFLHGKFHGQQSLGGYSPWGHKRVRHAWGCTHLLRKRYLKWNAFLQFPSDLWDWNVCHSSWLTKKCQIRTGPYLTQPPLKQISFHTRPPLSLKACESPVPTNHPFFISQVHFQVQILSNTISFFAPGSHNSCRSLAHMPKEKEKILLPFFLAGCVRKDQNCIV